MYEDNSMEREPDPSPSVFNIKMLAFIALGAAGLMLLNGIGSNSGSAPSNLSSSPISLPGLSAPSLPGMSQSPISLPVKTGQLLDRGVNAADKALDVIDTGINVTKSAATAIGSLLTPDPNCAKATKAATAPNLPSTGTSSTATPTQSGANQP